MQGDMFLWEKETDIVESFMTPLSRMDSESVKTDPFACQGTCEMCVQFTCTCTSGVFFF